MALAVLSSASAPAQDKRENPKPVALDFAATLLQGHSYLLTKDEAAAVDEILRQMREAENQLRNAKDDGTREQARKRQKEADNRLAAVLEKNANLKRISLQGGRVNPSIFGPHEMVGDTGALLLRVDNGGEGRSFSAYDINESLPEHGKTVWIDYAPTGVTWVLLGMHTLPANRITLPVEFRRPGAEPIRTLVEVIMPPVGRLKLTVLSDDTGKPTPAMVRITSKATNRDRKPSNVVDLTGQFDGNGHNSSQRPANIPGRQGGMWWCVPGPLDMTLPPGEYEIAIRRGIEHTPLFESFTIKSGEVTDKYGLAILRCRAERELQRI
ncbi:MAG TPA: hypothetical protein PLL20_12260, partial [Phycisphaerae bacterium]|nr:hypothetical protein [Phycisphaerae bacterium]